MSEVEQEQPAVKQPVTSIELTFDPDLDAAVRAEWAGLRDAGLSSLAAHTDPSNRPHLTLLARRPFPPVDLTEQAGRLPIPVTLGAPRLFGAGERRVLARLVVPTQDLLSLHHDVHHRVGPGEDLPFTAAGQWTPHVSLARRIRIDQLPQALPLLGGPLTGLLVGLRRWDSADRTITPVVIGGRPTRSP